MGAISQTVDKKPQLDQIKTFLARRFPGVEFFPRVIKYVGGQSLLLCWNDGPTEKDLNFFAELHKGANLSYDGILEPIESLVSLLGGELKEVRNDFDFILLRRYLTILEPEISNSLLTFI